eukprot:40028-Chlamydomonas_euryale.AAC.1
MSCVTGSTALPHACTLSGPNRVGGTLCPPGSGYGQPNIHTRLAEEDEVTICNIRHYGAQSLHAQQWRPPPLLTFWSQRRRSLRPFFYKQRSKLAH